MADMADYADLPSWINMGDSIQPCSGWRRCNVSPEAKVTEGVSIDDYSTWRAVRFAERDEIG